VIGDRPRGDSQKPGDKRNAAPLKLADSG
jgi:hypothetical protein